MSQIIGFKLLRTSSSDRQARLNVNSVIQTHTHTLTHTPAERHIAPSSAQDQPD